MNFEGLVSLQGRPVSGMTVELFEYRLGGASVLRLTETTDAYGRYNFSSVDTSQWTGAAYFVQVTASSGTEYGSEVRKLSSTAPNVADVEIESGHALPSEDATSVLAVADAIGELGGTVPIVGLEDDDLEVLRLSDHVRSVHVERVVSAAKVANGLNIDTDIAFALGDAIELDELSIVAVPRAELRAILERRRDEGGFEDASGSRIGATLDTITAQAWSKLKDVTVDPQRYSLKKLFGQVGLQLQEEDEVADFLLNYEGESFWDDLEDELTNNPSDPSNPIGAPTRSRLRGLTEVSQFTSYHWPLVEALDLDPNVSSDISGLSNMTRDEWLGIVQTAGVPAWASRVNIEPTTYALELYAQLEDRFPDVALVRTMNGSFTSDLQEVADVLKNPHLFDFFDDLTGGTNAGLLDGQLNQLSNKEAIKSNILRLQRLARVAPRGARMDVAVACYEAGYESAVDVAADSPQLFVQKVTAALPSGASSVPTQMLKVAHDTARERAAAVTALSWVALRPSREIQILPPMLRDVTNLPSYTQMFGPASACECAHCQSMFSPSAYLVDLLEWLKRIPTTGMHETMLEALRASHSHIMALKLSCSNANTQLPIIDLVIEELEHRVAPAMTPSSQTVGDAALLRAHPQQVNTDAYDDLAARGYPLSLPFALDFAENAAYAEPLGTTPAEVLAVTAPDKEIAWAQARLGANPGQWAIITSEDPTGAQEHWGGGPLGTLKQISTLVQRGQQTGHAPFDFEDVMDLTRSAFVQGDPTSPDAAMAIWVAGDDGCNLASAQLTNLSDEHLDRMQRVLRMQRLTGWSVEQIDRLVVGHDGLDEGTLIEAARLTQLSETLRVEMDTLLDWRFGVPIRSWAARLKRGVDSSSSGDGQGWLYRPTHAANAAGGPESRYAQVFRDPVDHELGNLALNVLGDALALPGQAADEVDALRSALKLTQADVQALMPALGSVLDKATVMAFNTHAGLARALRRPVDELLTLFDLGKVTMAPTLELSALREVVDLSAALRAANVAPADAEALLFGELLPDLEVTESLGRIRGGVQDILQSMAISGVDHAELVAEKLVSLASDDDERDDTRAFVDWAFAQDTAESVDWTDGAAYLTSIEDDIGPAWPGTLAALSYAHSQIMQLHEQRLMERSVAEATAVELGIDSASTRALLVHVGDDAATSLIAPPGSEPLTSLIQAAAAEVPELIGAKWSCYIDVDGYFTVESTVDFKMWGDGVWGLDEVVRSDAEDVGDGVFRAKAGMTWLPDPVDSSTAFQIASPPGSWSFTPDLDSPDGPYKSVSHLVSTPSRPAGEYPHTGLKPEGPPPLVAVELYQQIAYAAQLVKQLHLTVDDLPWVLDKAPALGYLDILEPPSITLAGDLGGARVNSWLKLVSAVALQARFDHGLFDVLHDESGGSLSASGAVQLAERGGWRLADLTELKDAIESDDIEHLLPVDWQAHGAVGWLADALDLARRLGASADQLLKLQSASYAARADIYKSLAASRYAPDRWLEEAAIVRDGLRIRQRDALVDAVMTDFGVDDVSALSDQLLMDVLMGPCQLTSRTKNACGQVQTFINQALLGLENGADIAEPNPAEAEVAPRVRRDWRWMKLYRVWEANRKVFLYPENWLEPGLHSNPSQLYEAFEAALSKGELTHERAEDAVLEYVRAFAGLGELKIVASCQFDEQIHLIGRTPTRPHRFFHRWRASSGWHPWRALDLPISDNEVFAQSIQRDGVEQLWLGWVHREGAGLNPDDWDEQKLDEGERLDLDDMPSPAKVWLEHASFDGSAWTPPQSTDVIGNGVLGPLSLGLGRLREQRPEFHTLFEDLELRIDPAEEIVNDTPQKAFLAGRLAALAGARYVEQANGLAQLQTGLAYDPIPKLFEHWDTFDSEDVFALDLQSSLTVDGETVRPVVALKHKHLIFDGTRYPLAGSRDAETTRRILYREYLLYEKNRVADAKQQLVGSLPTMIRSVEEGRPSAVQVFQTEHGFVAYVSWGSDKLRLGSFQLTQGGQISVEHHKIFERWRFAENISDPNVFKEQSWYLDQTSWSARVESQKKKNGCAVALSRTTPATFLFPGGEQETIWRLDYRFCARLRERALRGGVEAVYAGDKPFQVQPWFDPIADPSPLAIEADIVDMGREIRFDGGPYAQYHWELFYHLPLKVADALRQQQRFEEARRWIHFIFDPSRGGDDANKWLTRPLRALFSEEGQRHERSLRGLLQAILTDGETAHLRDALKAQVSAWMDSPFDPHALARLRPAVYAKRAIFAYLDILADWADQLFRRDTIESTTEANQLYRLAAELLGSPTEEIPQGEAVAQAYDDLDNLDALANARVLENHLNDERPAPLNDAFAPSLDPLVVNAQVVDLLPVELRLEAPRAPQPRREIERLPIELEVSLEGYFDDEGPSGPQRTYAMTPGDRPSSEDRQLILIASGGRRDVRYTVDREPLPPSTRWAPSLLFCLPGNDKLTSGYRALLTDRLFKLRNCMNIDGVKRSLALFEPPIDPGLLVRARAAGVDIADALSMQGGARSPLRFEACLAVAQRLVAQVRQLSQALLAATEKRDAEALAQLRVGHERALNDAVMLSRKEERRAAKESVKALKVSLKAAESRREYYSSRVTFSEDELAQIGHLESSQGYYEKGSYAGVANLAAASIAGFAKGTSGNGVHAVISSLAKDLTGAAAYAFDRFGQEYASKASLAGVEASYKRRQDDWDNLARQARFDVQNLERQIIAAELRVAISEHEIATQRLRAEQSSEVAEYLSGKFTNVALYDWMVNKLQGLHFQSYNIAFDYARKAELAWQFERVEDRSFVRYGAWDGLKRGLLAAEQLELDLTRMQAAWYEKDRREYELTRHVSLLSVDPEELNKLRTEGSCRVVLPESLFDMDAPGHYLRRIKTVALSLPSVTGPYVPVHCTLTLERSSLRVSAATDPGYVSTGVDDARFLHDRTAVESIVTSQAQADTGLFEVALNDARYLPFEGAGAVSQWRLELPSGVKHFDYASISDAILHLRYTAREGGSALRSAAVAAVNTQLQAVPQPPVPTPPTVSEEVALNAIFQPLKESELERYNATGTVTVDIEGVPYAIVDRIVMQPNDLSTFTRDGGAEELISGATLPPVPTYDTDGGVLSVTIERDDGDTNSVVSAFTVIALYGVNPA